MQRIRNTSRNTAASAVRFFIQLLVQLAVRTIFIHILGRELLGLDSLFINVIQLLNIAELGIGAAMGYSMYKPAAEGNIEKLKSYDALFKKIFIVIAGVVLLIGLAIIPVIPYLIQGEPQVGINIYIIYGMFLADTVVSYFAAHKRTLLFVHQQQHINMLVLTAKFLFLGLLQVLMLLGVKDYYFYAAAAPFATLFECIAILVIAKKLHPLIKGKASPLDKEAKKVLITNISALSLHKISGAVITAISGIFVSIFFGLNILGIFSNYILIIFALTLMISLLLQSVQASIGNMIASADKDENRAMFNTLNLGYWFFIGFVSICLFCLIQPFIIIWIGADWTFSFFIMLAVVVRFFVSGLRGGIPNLYKDAAGLMRKDWWRALAEPVLNIVLSIWFLHIWGVAGIFIGTIAAAIFTCVWTEPFVVFKYYFKKSVWPYYLKLFTFCLVTVILGTAAYYACMFLPQGFVYWVLRLIICSAVAFGGYCLFYCATKDFKNLCGLFKTVLKSFRRNKKADACPTETDASSADAAAFDDTRQNPDI